MRIDKLESGKRDDLRHLNDDDLVLVTGGFNPGGIFGTNGKLVFCTCGPISTWTTVSECNYLDHLYGC